MAYEQAKKEMKNYHENILDERINKFVKSKDRAKQKAGGFGKLNN